jgi:hypothetical protein
MRRPPPWHGVAHRSLAGCPVALASLGEALELPCVHARQPILAVRGRWADQRVAANMRVAQGERVRPVLVDPCVYPIAIRSFPLQCAENFAALALADLDVDLRPDGHVRVSDGSRLTTCRLFRFALGPVTSPSAQPASATNRFAAARV